MNKPTIGANAFGRCLVAVFVVFGVSACYLLDEQTRRFHRFYSYIENGMSVEKVERLFREAYPSAEEDGWPVMGQNECGLWFTLDPRTGRFNSEIINAEFEGGVVVSKKYLPD